MRIIPTNRFLLKCNIGHTTLCDFCCMEIETLDHLFWECIHVQLLWTNLSTLLQDYNHYVFIYFNLRNIMLGITVGTNQTEVQTKNFINLLGKHFIFKNKYKKTTPKFISFQIISKTSNQYRKTHLFQERQTCPIHQKIGKSQNTLFALFSFTLFFFPLFNNIFLFITISETNL